MTAIPHCRGTMRGACDSRRPQAAVHGIAHGRDPALAPHAEGALVVGQSGGATLALALAASDRSASQLPSPMSQPSGPSCRDCSRPWLRRTPRAVSRLGATLYGPSWSIVMAPPDHTRIPSELAMFRAFEPAAPREHQGSILVTVGAKSPRIRHEAAAACTPDSATTSPDCTAQRTSPRGTPQKHSPPPSRAKSILRLKPA